MRILYINDELATGDGSNYHALGIWYNLKKQLGEENVRAYPTPSDGSGARVNRRGIGLREAFRFPLQLLRILRKSYLSRKKSRAIIHKLTKEGFTPTHILCRTTLFDTTALYVARHFHAKLITECNAPMYYEHGVMGKLPLQKAMKSWEKKMLISSQYIYTVSEVCKNMLVKEYELTDSNFLVIPNGYEPKPGISEEDRAAIRYSLRTAEHLEDKKVITFVGSLKKWHGIDALCALAEAMEQYPEYHFLVIGDGAEYEMIENYVLKHHNMTYKGKLSSKDMYAWLYASDLGILPYHKMENFYFSPLKLYDTIGAGLPFLGTDQGQIHSLCHELLDERFLISDCEPGLMTKKILAVTQSEETYRSMQAGIQSIQSRVTWEERVKTLLLALEP